MNRNQEQGTAVFRDPLRPQFPKQILRAAALWTVVVFASASLTHCARSREFADFTPPVYAARPVQPEGVWERDPRPLICNFRNMYQPEVIEISGVEYRYRMWFFGWAMADYNPFYHGCDAIFHARSRDLLHWEVYAGEGQWDRTMNPARWVPVIVADGKPYDAFHNGDPSVVLKDGRFYMAFGATSKPFPEPRGGHPEQMLLCVMGATSEDGICWRKTNQPLLIDSVETPPADSAAKWMGGFLRPSLLWDEGKWRLWFDYWHSDHGTCMGYAENTGKFGRRNGFHIMHDLDTPLIYSWVNPDVVRVGDTYHSFADPISYPPMLRDPNALWTSRQLCEAVSPDGIHWEVVGYIAPDDDVPALHAPQALVTEQSGERWLYLFYATQIGHTQDAQIYDYRYDKIRAMRRRIEPTR